MALDLIHQLGVNATKHSITVREGTYDADASFDRETAGDRQGEIDDMIQDTASLKNPAPPPEQVSSIAQDDIDAMVSSESVADAANIDIDALVDSAQNGTSQAESDPVDVDNIDDLVASATEESASDPVDVDNIDDLVASATEEDPVETDDVDALVDTAKNEPKENATFDQDDIDALLGDQ